MDISGPAYSVSWPDTGRRIAPAPDADAAWDCPDRGSVEWPDELEGVELLTDLVRD